MDTIELTAFMVGVAVAYYAGYLYGCKRVSDKVAEWMDEEIARMRHELKYKVPKVNKED